MLDTTLRRTLYRRTLVAATAMLFVALCTDNSLAQRLSGRLAGGKYTTPRGLFTVDVPKARNWAQVPFTIEEQTETGDRNYDAVFFWVKDFGEVRSASVRRIPQTVLDDMAARNPRVVAQGLADKALLDWRQNLTDRPALTLDTFVMTQYGESALRIYRVEKGSLLMTTSGGRKPEAFDALVGVMAVKRGDHYISAIAEDDANVSDQDGLSARLQEFFSAIVVPDRPGFDKRDKR